MNASELVGNQGNHSLPDYSHTKNGRIYVKKDKRGFREMRVYDDDGKVILEIAFHPERNLDSSGSNVLHYHLYGKNFERSVAKAMDNEIYNLYKKYLNHWGIYWNEKK